MTLLSMRKKIANYIQQAEDEKVKAVYTLLESDIAMSEMDFDEELKSKLDEGFAHYHTGGAMVSSKEMQERVISKLNSISEK